MKIIGWLLFIPTLLLTALFGFGVALYQSSDVTPPQLSRDFSDCTLHKSEGMSRFCGSLLKQGQSGFWELQLVGDEEQRGHAMGVLCDSLINVQERSFVRQILSIVPDKNRLRFLHWLTVIFNRNLQSHIPAEYCREIAAMSQGCSHEFDFIGSPYMRQLNYHAAHDIGHAMQEYMLVGCSAFGCRNAAADGRMYVGRNFDFYVGDDFARNRLLTFCHPHEGYRFVSIGWAGMVGVMSGMNEKGLSVTLNAAKGDIPFASATPVSLLAREILQYCATIAEAERLAQKRRLFVSEMLLIGSAADGDYAVIEKTPATQALYTTQEDIIACTNHFQSEHFRKDEDNCRNILFSDSRRRLERLDALLHERLPMTPERAVTILRDHRTTEGTELGLRNQMSINQQIAHHSVLFELKERKMWLSTQYWGMGEWVCYDVGKILSGEHAFDEELTDGQRIGADSLFLKHDLPALRAYARIIRNPKAENVDSLPLLNPSNWESHTAAAKFHAAHGDTESAVRLYRQALEREMPLGNRMEIEKRIKSLK